MKLQQVSQVVAESERVATITIYQPNDEPYRGADGEEATLSFTGSESKAYRHAREIIQRRTLRKQQTKLEPADILRNQVDLASAVVTGWSGWEDDNGQPAAFSRDGVRQLLQAEHILSQLQEGINRHASFFGAPSETSPTP
jgi:hypothetical protein